MLPTHCFACGFWRINSPRWAACPTSRCTFIASLALTPSKRSGMEKATATPTYSWFGNFTPTMRLYTALAAGGAMFDLPSSTRNMPSASVSDTPSFRASSCDTRFMTRAALAAPSNDPAPRILSTFASSPLPLRMWCTRDAAQSVTSHTARTAPTAAFIATLSFSLMPVAATHGSIETSPMLFSVILAVR